MYNDYYLQQIDSKMSTNNSLLDDIIANQESLSLQITSGDQALLARLERTNTDIIVIQLIIAALLIYQFIVRCLR